MPTDVQPISVTRSTIAGGLAFGIFYVACWLGIPLKLSVSHMFLQLFTTRPLETVGALGEGLLWSIVFGALISFLATFFYTIIPLGRRA